MDVIWAPIMEPERKRHVLTFMILPLIEKVLSNALWELPLTSAQEGSAPSPLAPGTPVIRVTLYSADLPASLLHQTVCLKAEGSLVFSLSSVLAWMLDT